MTTRFNAPPVRASLANPELYRPNQYDSWPRQTNILGLDRGECIDPELTGIALNILRNLPAESVYCYPVPGPLYRRLARHLNVTEDRLLLTRGSDGAIKTVFETFIDPGDTVLFPDPTYQMYSVYAQIFGARTELVPYAMTAAGPVIEADALARRIVEYKPKLVGLPNPDNPTGFAFSADQMRQIIEAAGEADALILVDEAYYPFHDVTVLPWIEKYGHLIVARTFSKAWGLAGLRLGYTAATPKLTVALHKTRNMVEADGVSMALAERLLDHETDVRDSIERLKAGRAYFADQMNALGFHAIETAGNFIHVDFKELRSDVEQALSNVARYRVFADTCLRDYLRFTTTTIDLFSSVIDTIRTVVETAGQGRRKTLG